MRALPSRYAPDQRSEKVRLGAVFCGKYRVFAGFILCAALLIAAFSAGGIYSYIQSARDWQEGGESSPPMGTTLPSTSLNEGETEEAPPSLEQTDDRNGIKVIEADLSHLSRGEGYYLNETAYSPDLESLLERELSVLGTERSEGKPLVLILHTHTTESYLLSETTLVEGDLGDLTYSSDREENMISIGKVLCEALNANGMEAIHCTVDHTQGGSLRGSYERSAETVRQYLALYPSIRLVIDLHRDAVLTEDGEYIKTASGADAAQVMPVVGTDSNGTACPNWEGNLALALQLRRALNASGDGICRPIYLRSSSYNQELAPYSLLIEIGTGGNTKEEAQRTAAMLGDALCQLLK